jgi:hypothetical protein
MVRSVALFSALALTVGLGIGANAATTTPQAGWGSGFQDRPSDRVVLRFANQPNTTKTGEVITDAVDGARTNTGGPIRVEIFDPVNRKVVDSTATVTLTQIPAQGVLSGNSAVASAGVATFTTLSLNQAGRYKLQASSPAVPASQDSNPFMVADTIETCIGSGCSFTQTELRGSYTTTPKKGNAATFVSSLNLEGLRVSCEFAPYNYEADRQPNAVWYTYDDPSGDPTNLKTNKIVIGKAWVQNTPENGASAYRVCYASPVPFKDWFGNNAPADPVAPPDINGDLGPSSYFGATWYVGLLPDCGNKKNPPAPCVLSWTGDSAGNRVGMFVTPPGDPAYR